jgi:2-polyprenyl-3-methyl-5-hydroxy-6-metoxy-1,4-benzoquinol methylase
MTELDGLLDTFPCDLCGKRDEEFLYTKQGVLTGYPFRVVRCRSCGLVYINPRLGEQVIAELYDKYYYNGKGFDPNVNYIADYDRENDTDKQFRPEETVKAIKRIVLPPAMLLDFGCGLGDLMRQAARHGYRAEGFEVSHFAAEFAKANKFRVYDNLDQLPTSQYDIVTAVEVLEHCSSPMEALSAIYRSLKPGGTLYYTTRNFDGFYKKWRVGVKDSLDGYIVPEGHIHFFSTKVIRSYFKKIGYSKTFYFEPRTRGGRFFRLLLRLGLIETADSPITSLERLWYFRVRKAPTMLGLGNRLLPLATK